MRPRHSGHRLSDSSSTLGHDPNEGAVRARVQGPQEAHLHAAPHGAEQPRTPNPRWFVPVMLALMLIGLVWVVTYYISGANEYPVPQLGRWNLGVGFGFMMAGFLMTTRWR